MVDEKQKRNKAKHLHIGVVVCNRNEAIEVVVPIDIWNRAGFIVELISLEKKKNVILENCSKIACDDTIDKINLSQYHAIYLPGGPGYEYYLNSKVNAKLKKTLEKYFKDNKNKWILSMCASPSVIAEWDLINNRYYTCYPGFEKKEKFYYKDEAVIVSDGLITGRSPGAVFEFAFAVVEKLDSIETAEKIKKEIIYNQ